MTVSGSLRTTAQGELAGAEQAANALQPGNSSRHATTANAKVRGGIEALRLVRRWRCLRSRQLSKASMWHSSSSSVH
jgi:hypothetical protein